MSTDALTPSGASAVSRRFADVLAFALQLMGVTKANPFKGSFEDMLADERLANALGPRGMRLVTLAWLVVSDQRVLVESGIAEKDDMQQLAVHLAAVLPDQAHAILDATPLSRVARISEPRIFTPADSVQTALGYLASNGRRFVAYVPAKGEPGLVSLADVGMWYAHEAADDPYGEPLVGSTSLASCSGAARRDWRAVSSTMTVGELASLMSRADHRLAAALVLSPAASPQGVVEARDMVTWGRPSHSMRERASAVLGLWRSRHNQSSRRGGAPSPGPDAIDWRPLADEASTLLGLDRVTDALLDADEDGFPALAEEVRKLVAPLGQRGVEPSALLDALQGRRTRATAELSLDASAGFGSGALLPASTIGQALQLLCDHGLLANTPFGTLACSPAWTSETDLSWADDVDADQLRLSQGLPSTASRPAEQEDAARAAVAEASPAAPGAGEQDAHLADEDDGAAKPVAEASPSNQVEQATGKHRPVAPEAKRGTRDDGKGKSSGKTQPKGGPAPAVAKEGPAQGAKGQPSPLKPLPYAPYQGQRQKGDFYKAGNLLSLSAAVIRAEGPIASSLLVRRVASLWGIAKVTGKVRARFKEVLPQTGARAGMMVTEFNGERFYMTPAQHAKPQVRTNAGTKSGRSSSEIPLEEIRVVVLHELAQGPVGRAKLAKSICEAFGLDPSKQTAKRMAGQAIDTLAEMGKVWVEGKQVSLP